MCSVLWVHDFTDPSCVKLVLMIYGTGYTFSSTSSHELQYVSARYSFMPFAWQGKTVYPAKLNTCSRVFYASAFRGRRHYSLGLSDHPLVHLTNWLTNRPKGYCPNDRLINWLYVCPSVRLSVQRGFQTFSCEYKGGMGEIWYADVCWPPLD